MKRITWSLFLPILLVAAGISTSYAESSYQTSFRNTYPNARGSVIDNCTICHPGGDTNRLNSYANAYSRANRSYTSIEGADSDGDGFTNLAEITAFTYPGDAASRPTPVPANRAPVASAGTDQTVVAGAAVTLNGAASNDPDGGTLTYAWTQTGGAAVNLTGANTVSARFTAPNVTASATFTFLLTVRDTGNLSSTDTIAVTVNPAGTTTNRAPTANAGVDKAASSGTTVTLAGAGSDPDAGDSLTYTWVQIGTPSVALANANTATATFTAPSVQSSTILTFQLTVRDRAGATATDTCAVTVSASGDSNGGTTGSPPIADAGLDIEVLPGTLNNLSGFYSSDSDDGIAAYSWTQTGGPAVTLSSPTVSDPVFHAPASPATLSFTLRVTDKSGQWSEDTCNVVVLSATGSGTTPAPNPTPTPPPSSVNQPPVANAGPDQSVRSGSTARLSGAASMDPDDGIASYRWTQTSGTSVRLSGASTASASFTAPRVSRSTTLNFRLTVKDRGGLSSSDTVRITISGSRGSDDDDDDDDD